MHRSLTILHRHVLPTLIVLLWCGMLWSRALLSLGMVVFCIVAVILSGPRMAWHVFRREPAAWGLVLLFFIPFFTVWWSDDKRAWLDVMRTKLPFLVLPFTIAGMRAIPIDARRWIGCAVIASTLVAAVMVLWGYVGRAGEVHAAYLRGAVMHVPMEDDHVRFGWAVALVHALLWGSALSPDAARPFFGRKTDRWLLVVTGLFLLLLSSRTGWLGLMLAVGHALVRLPKRKSRLLLITVAIVVPVAAWLFMPSVVNRVRFMVWDYQQYSRGGYVKGLNDAPRLVSWQAGLDLIKERPITGTGAGDLGNAVHDWYATHRPDMPAEEWLLPANEWIFHGAMAGVPGILAFCAALVLLFRRRSPSIVWNVAMGIAFLGFFYEIGLELQYGVFLFGFVTTFLIAMDAGPEDHEFSR